MSRRWVDYLTLGLRGMAMGAADVVPGVSGGTIAFISGIYSELIDSLKSFDQHAISALRKGGITGAWKHVNGGFLLAVFSGVLISIFTLASLVEHLLAVYPIAVWSFFFGLVAASAIYLGRQITGWTYRDIALLLMGAVIASIINQLKPAQLPLYWWVFTLAGSVAICAMILPGISGSFLLLMAGLYTPFIEAIASFNFKLLLSFVVGAAIGLLSFSHLLSWLLHSYYRQTMALLTGVLLGSLQVIWPWKQVLEVTLDRHGSEIPLVQQNVSPFFYESLGLNASLLSAAIMAIVGIVLVLSMEWVATGSHSPSSESR